MFKREMQPQFKHDCGDCHFLGLYEYEGQSYDLYSCGPKGKDNAVVEFVARFSDEGSEYNSYSCLICKPIGPPVKAGSMNGGMTFDMRMQPTRIAVALWLLERVDADIQG